MARLIIISLDGKERDVPLAAEPLTIGRGDDADVKIPDAKTSRTHIRLFPGEDGAWHVLDLESRNGTLLNGEPVSAGTALNPGDVIRIGFTLIAFESFPEIFATPEDVAVAREKFAEALQVARQAGRAASDAPDAEAPPAVPDDAVPVGRLRHLRGGSGSMEIRLSPDRPFRIGRKPGNDLVIEEKNVSSFHAEVRLEDGVPVLVDLDSTNGVWVSEDGKDSFFRKPRTVLKPGVVFRVSVRLFGFETEAEPLPAGLVKRFSDALAVPENAPPAPAAGSSRAERPAGGTAPEKTPATPPAETGAPAPAPPNAVKLRVAALSGGAFLLLMAVLAFVAFRGEGGAEPAENGDKPAGGPEKPPETGGRRRGRVLVSDAFDEQNDRGFPPDWRLEYSGVRGGVRVIQKKDRNNRYFAIDKSGADTKYAVSALVSEWKPVENLAALRASCRAMNDETSDGLFGLRIRFRGSGRDLASPRVRFGVCPEFVDMETTARVPAWADEVRLELFTMGRAGQAMFDDARLEKTAPPDDALPDRIEMRGMSFAFDARTGAAVLEGPERAILPRIQVALAHRETRRIVVDSGAALAVEPSDENCLAGVLASDQAAQVSYEVRAANFDGAIVLDLRARGVVPEGLVPVLALEMNKVHAHGLFYYQPEGEAPEGYGRRIATGSYTLVVVVDDGGRTHALRILVKRQPESESRSWLAPGDGGRKVLVVEAPERLTVRFESMDATDLLRANLPNSVPEAVAIPPGEMASDVPPTVVGPAPGPGTDPRPVHPAGPSEAAQQAALKIQDLIDNGELGEAHTLCSRFEIYYSTNSGALLAHVQSQRRKLDEQAGAIRVRIENLVEEASGSASYAAMQKAWQEIEKESKVWGASETMQPVFKDARKRLKDLEARLDAERAAVEDKREDEAQRLLEKARNMFRMKRYTIAEPFLKTLVNDYGDTKAAEEGREMLRDTVRHVEARRREKVILMDVKALEDAGEWRKCLDFVSEHPDWKEYGAEYMPRPSRKKSRNGD